MSIKRMLGVLLLTVLTVSCGDSSDDQEVEQISIQFMSYKKPCYGLFQKLCLVESNDDSLLNFYDSIDGFEFVWGHAYKLQVNVTKLADNKYYADRSSVEYELVEVLSDEEDAIGSVYQFNLVELLSSTVTKEASSYYFLGQAFQCSSEVDCDALVELNDSGGYVNLTFEYAGNDQIILSGWD